MSNLKKQKSDSINSELSQVLPGSIHYNFNFPWDLPTPHFEDGKGHFLIDADGNQYLDFFSKFGANILGHKNKEYTEKISKFILNDVTSVNHFGDQELEAVRKISSVLPIEDAQFRFCLSGTEAVLNAIRLARAYTGKNKIARFHGHYHGGADSILGGISFVDDGYVPREMDNDPRGTSGRSRSAFSDTILIAWNDIGLLQEILEANKDDIAGIIMEPICINGGGISASSEYFKSIKDLSKKYGFLVIYDEVITGFRLNYGSVYKQTEIEPDIWIFGKAIAGGSLPVSCLGASKSIMSHYTEKRVTHSGTFNGYPIGLYALSVTLDILSRENVYEKAINYSKEIKNLINNAAQDLELDIVVQGPPMAMVIHASEKEIQSTNEWTKEIKAKEEIIRDAFLKEGVLLAPPCRIYPNTMIDKDVVEFFSEKIYRVMEDIKERFTILN